MTRYRTMYDVGTNRGAFGLEMDHPTCMSAIRSARTAVHALEAAVGPVGAIAAHVYALNNDGRTTGAEILDPCRDGITDETAVVSTCNDECAGESMAYGAVFPQG